MIDKAPPLDLPQVFDLLLRPSPHRKLQLPRERVKEALMHLQDTKPLHYIIEHSGLSKYRVLRVILLPLYKKSLQELHFLEIITPRFDNKVRRKILAAQKRPEMFQMISERRKDGNREYGSLDERSFLLLKGSH